MGRGAPARRRRRDTLSRVPACGRLSRARVARMAQHPSRPTSTSTSPICRRQRRPRRASAPTGMPFSRARAARSSSLPTRLDTRSASVPTATSELAPAGVAQPRPALGTIALESYDATLPCCPRHGSRCPPPAPVGAATTGSASAVPPPAVSTSTQAMSDSWGASAVLFGAGSLLWPLVFFLAFFARAAMLAAENSSMPHYGGAWQETIEIVAISGSYVGWVAPSLLALLVGLGFLVTPNADIDSQSVLRPLPFVAALIGGFMLAWTVLAVVVLSTHGPTATSEGGQQLWGLLFITPVSVVLALVLGRLDFRPGREAGAAAAGGNRTAGTRARAPRRHGPLLRGPAGHCARCSVAMEAPAPSAGLPRRRRVLRVLVAARRACIDGSARGDLRCWPSGRSCSSSSR